MLLFSTFSSSFLEAFLYKLPNLCLETPQNRLNLQTLYFDVKLETASLLCFQIHLIKFDVIPLYRVPFLSLAKYINIITFGQFNFEPEGYRSLVQQ